MPEPQRLDVWLDHTLLGRISQARRGSKLMFEYGDAVVAERELNTPYLSCSLPVVEGRHAAGPFLEGLLPEGDHRNALARAAGVLSTDVRGLLARYGRDVAGAVTIVERDLPRADTSAEPYSAESLDLEVTGLASRPLAVYEDSELSLAGMQNKMLLVQTPEGWARPVHGYPSTHILKLDDRFRPGLVRAECAALALARAAGLQAAEAEVVTVAGVECLITRRFDRAPASGHEPRRVHQEDACQALGAAVRFDGRGKYELEGGPTLRGIASLLASWAVDPDVEQLRLLDHVLFTVAIGNADAHGKNVAMLHPRPGEIVLAPLYDTVPTCLWPTLRNEAAMTVGGAVDMPAITLADVLNEASAWGLSERTARARAVQTLERLLAAAESFDDHGDTRVSETTTLRVSELLSARDRGEEGERYGG